MGEEEGNAFTILSGEWTLSNTPQPPHESHTGGVLFLFAGWMRGHAGMVVGVTGFQLIKETYKSFWTGECLRCDGTGRLSCTKCKGFGYLRKSRRSPSDDDVSNIYLCPFCGSQARNQSRKEWRSAAIDRACYVKGILRSLCRVLAPATSVRAKEASGSTCPTSSGCAGYLVSLAWKGSFGAHETYSFLWGGNEIVCSSSSGRHQI